MPTTKCFNLCPRINDKATNLPRDRSFYAYRFNLTGWSAACLNNSSHQMNMNKKINYKLVHKRALSIEDFEYVVESSGSHFSLLVNFIDRAEKIFGILIKASCGTSHNNPLEPNEIQRKSKTKSN